ncbi:protein-L-isoaspartate (D-aspartate) O-methyltransferase [Aureococcus anophagefferens]|nr:protein-L-isoaspartate (D-aspartate) O-methyltransferase [Aureococcus anophagefferens]
MLRRTLLLLSAQPARSWMSSAFSNDGLVAALVRDGAIELPETAAALRRVDRRNFARAVGDPSALEDAEVYRDAPLPIGPLATISAPHMHARCLDLLAPPLLAKERAGAASRVLDVGSGSGCLTAAFALLGDRVTRRRPRRRSSRSRARTSTATPRSRAPSAAAWPSPSATAGAATPRAGPTTPSTSARRRARSRRTCSTSSPSAGA